MKPDPAQRELPVYVVIGTRAQFIKVAPLLRNMRDQNLRYTLIHTAQHQENIDEILSLYDLPQPDVVMYGHREANTRSSFARWFAEILFKVLFRAKEFIPQPGILLTHGDTFTAWLGACMGRRAGCRIGHIESGCRSFNILSPFPEELSRLITFSLTDIYFCADEWAINNLRGYKGMKINMGANTMLDGVRYALNHESGGLLDFQQNPYALVSIHRFENIFTDRFTGVILPLIREIAMRYRLVFILHPTTRERLKNLNLLDELSGIENLIMHERLGFVDWIKTCSKAQFVITDGGSNQEELSYLGVPTLLFRSETERKEGLGQNIIMSRFNREIINRFIDDPEQYRRANMPERAEPSQRIIETIYKRRDPAARPEQSF
jgi:UDP-N-acetylglucosamine 2-epimerase (non-hydrolysing)